jgi:hypothetical protein
MADEVLIILRDARSILDMGFCKRALARRGNGLPCKPTDPRAVSHCAIGAIAAAAGIETKNGHEGGTWSKPAKEALREVRAAVGAKEGALADWNNRWWRTKPGVLGAFDKAIAFRERENQTLLQIGSRESLLIPSD